MKAILIRKKRNHSYKSVINRDFRKWVNNQRQVLNTFILIKGNNISDNMARNKDKPTKGEILTH